MNIARSLAIVVAAVAGIVTPAIASTRAYNIAPGETRAISITAQDDFYLKAVGGENTDLDFRLVSPVGRTMHVDIDGTSWTEKDVTLDRAGVYTLYVQNVGDEQNAVTLTLN